MRNPTTVSLYLHEDLEAHMQGMTLGRFARGSVISAALIWSVANCGDPADPKVDDVTKMLEHELTSRRLNKKGYAARRTAAQLTPAGFDLLLSLANGPRTRMSVIDACLERFTRLCTDQAEQVMAVIEGRPGPGRPPNMEPSVAISSMFTHEVIQILRGISAQTGVTISAIVSDIVTRALTEPKLPNPGEGE